MYLDLQERFGIDADKQKGIDDLQTFVNMAPDSDTTKPVIINIIRSLENAGG